MAISQNLKTEKESSARARIRKGTGHDFWRASQSEPTKTISKRARPPTKTQALNADGHLLTRILRTRDERERITRIQTILDDPDFSVLLETEPDMIAQAGVSLREMAAQSTKTFNVIRDEMGKSCTL